MLSNLAAIFTAIPIEVNSFFLSEPKMPENTLPVDMPIPILSLNPSWLSRLPSISFAFCCIAIADLTALTASSEWATGDPKTTIILSPMCLSTVPLCLYAISPIGEKYLLFRKEAIASGGTSCDILVNPRISEKSIDTSWNLGVRDRGEASISLYTCSGTNCFRCFFTLISWIFALNSILSNGFVRNPSMPSFVAIMAASIVA